MLFAIAELKCMWHAWWFFSCFSLFCAIVLGWRLLYFSPMFISMFAVNFSHHILPDAQQQFHQHGQIHKAVRPKPGKPTPKWTQNSDWFNDKSIFNLGIEIVELFGTLTWLEKFLVCTYCLSEKWKYLGPSEKTNNGAILWPPSRSCVWRLFVPSCNSRCANQFGAEDCLPTYYISYRSCVKCPSDHSPASFSNSL